MKLALVSILILFVISSYGGKKVKHENKLINEKSQYLLQHANNPVYWYPWGEEAFSKAVKENKPIFLSIGYATCHWCHVMEHESFESEEVAALLNEGFVCIKVDREERPDIDTIYMSVCQMMTGSGGWPLTIFMTPEKKPFFSATYIPKESKFGRTGMLELLPKIRDLWKNRKKDVLKSADEITKMINVNISNSGTGSINDDILKFAKGRMETSFDSQFGGFGSSPKFPSSHKLTFLLQNYHYSKNPGILSIVETTLEKMRLGGIYDQIGYGFHRYSTDKRWFLPHFEKMLYDQAMLSYTYLEAYQLTGKKFYADVAEEIFEYIHREMISPEGAFYSAEDADSEGEEGKYYVWGLEELKGILSESELKFLKERFNLTEVGNFIDEVHRKSTGKNVLFLNNRLSEKEKTIFEPIRKKILSLRAKRIHPLKDTKVLTDWNGLMIASFAKAARVLNKKKYEKIAISAMNFLLSKMLLKDNKLMHRYREGHIAINGKLDDYAFLIYGLMELYETTLDIEYLENAVQLNDFTIKHFLDEKHGAFYFTSDYDEKLISRPKDGYDGAIPSGNSIAALSLIKLAKITGNTSYETIAEKLIKSFSSSINQAPDGFAQMLIALQFAKNDSMEIVITGDRKKQETKNIIKAINHLYIPNKVILFKDPVNNEKIVSLASYTKNQKMVDNKTTVYICRGQVCKKPSTDIKEVLEMLKK